MADEAAPRLLPVAADRDKDDRRRCAAHCGFAVLGIMSTLLVYGILQVGWVGLLVVFPPSLLPAPQSATISSPVPTRIPRRTETSYFLRQWHPRGWSAAC